MSDVIPPNNEPVIPPSPARNTEPEGDEAAHYIARELAAARVSLNRTRLIGAIIVIVVLIETIYVTGNMQKFLRPQAAADIADGIIAQRVQDQGPAIKDAIEQRVPVLISQLPDQAIQQLPGYRESFENQFEANLTSYAQSSSQQLDTQLGDYLASHKDEVHDALTAGKDSASVHELGNGLTQGFVESLKDTSSGGESAKDKIDKSLAALQEVQKKMDRLANAKDLTPAEKKTRHMIAIMSRTVSKQVPKISALPTVEATSIETPAAPVAQ